MGNNKLNSTQLNTDMIVTFTKRVQIQLRSVNHLVILWVSCLLIPSVNNSKKHIRDLSFIRGGGGLVQLGGGSLNFM